MFKKISSANNTQKMIFTIWLIVSIVSGYLLALKGAARGKVSFDDYFDAAGSSVIGIPTMMVILGIPAFILWKAWKDKE